MRHVRAFTVLSDGSLNNKKYRPDPKENKIANIKRIMISFAVMAVFSLCVGLGVWQLHRANDKAALIQSIENQQLKPPLDRADLLGHPDPAKLRYLPVAWQGKPLNAFPILLENCFKGKKLGYQWYTLVSLSDDEVLLVQREWAPRGNSRQELPPTPEDLSEMPIAGTLDFPYRNPFIGAAIESDDIHWPLRMQTLDIEVISQLVQKAVYPMIVIDKITPSTHIPIPPERHRAYAVQWFGLALGCLIVAACVLRSQHKSKR